MLLDRHHSNEKYSFEGRSNEERDCFNIIISKVNSATAMQRQFKVKTKLSFSPGKTKENIYVVQARLGTKPSSGLLIYSPDKNG
jgi:competence protein ComGF